MYPIDTVFLLYTLKIIHSKMEATGCGEIDQKFGTLGSQNFAHTSQRAFYFGLLCSSCSLRLARFLRRYSKVATRKQGELK